jgi:pimeloyl-ACP methyl ester carboxylesterase
MEDPPDLPVPPRPSPREERLSWRLFRGLGPRLEKAEQPEPPEALRPFEQLLVPLGPNGDRLSATWYPLPDGERPARGAVLLLHPWLSWGKAYFHRRGRLAALRAAGYQALALDLAGFGSSSRPSGFHDRDVEAGLRYLRGLAPGLPLHVWGISSGGYWAHIALARERNGIAGAMFEDVSPHLFEWSWRMAPAFRPAYLFFRTVFAASHRFLDIRRHARALRAGATTYVSGGEDRGVLPEDTRDLAAASGGRHRVIPGAGHLASIKLANEEILELALDTFRRGEEASSSSL